MDVQLEKPEGLLRQMRVRIPAEKVSRAFDERLKALAQRARIPGFRPGKAPLKVVEQQYGDSARLDVINDLVRRTYPEALTQAGVNPAGPPNFEVTAESPGQPLEYVARFEVFPEIELKGLSGLKVEKPVVKVEDADVEKLIGNLRQSRRTFSAVSRAAREGDVVVADFEGKIAGEPFTGGKGEGVEIEIGSKRFLPDLENALVGKSANDAFTTDVKFPENYQAENLKGKTTQFDVKVKEVREAKLPEIDAEFLKSHKVEPDAGEAGLRDKCRKALEQERDKAVKNKLKSQVLEQLLEANPIQIPQAMLQQETERLRQETAARFNAARLKPEQQKQMIPDEVLAPAAQRRVALGLLIAEVIKSRKIELDPVRLEKQLDEMAGDYEKPEEVKQFYRSRPDMMQGLRALVLEEQVTETLLSGISPAEKPMKFDDLMSPAS